LNTAKAETAQLIRYAVDRLATRLDGLTEEEYLWEPAPGCWTVRNVDGEWRADVAEDGTSFAPDPQPITTIAWRLWHLGASPERPWPPLAESFVVDYFDEIPAPARRPVATASEAVAQVVGDWRRFADAVSGWDDADFFEPMGPIAHRFADASPFGLVLHLVDELIHHGAEVALLRDLYASRR